MGASTTRLVDPRGLTIAQLAGDRCGISNCRRRLASPRTIFGQTPDGTPVFVCGDHNDPAVEE